MLVLVVGGEEEDTGREGTEVVTVETAEDSETVEQCENSKNTSKGLTSRVGRSSGRGGRRSCGEGGGDWRWGKLMKRAGRVWLTQQLQGGKQF